MMNTNKLIVTILLVVLYQYMPAAGARILADEEVSSAAIDSLAQESALFETLQKGIALTLADCEESVCIPSVRKQELQRIVDILGLRVSNLGVRYEESGEAELEKILLSYVDSLEVYSNFIEKLATIAPELDVDDSELPEEEDIFAQQFGSMQNIRGLYSVFEDIDEEIEDDEDIEEMELPVEEPATEEQIQ